MFGLIHGLAFVGGIGVPELLIILVIILIIFGAGKLPQIGDALGKGIRNFRNASKPGDDDAEAAPKTPAARPRGELPAATPPGRADRVDVEYVDAKPRSDD